MKSAFSLRIFTFLFFIPFISLATVGTDNFDDNSVDPAKWGSDMLVDEGTNVVLSETSGHLELSGTVPANVTIVRPWISQLGSYTQSWETAVDVHVDDLALPEGTGLSMFLAVVDGGDQELGDHMSVSLELENDQGTVRRGYYLSYATNNVDLDNMPSSMTTNLEGRVRISFEASTKELSAYYNDNLLQSIDVSDPSSNWEMDDQSSFMVALGGDIRGSSYTLAGGYVYADNFSMGPVIPPEEFTYVTNGASLRITGYIGTSGGNVEIPEMIHNDPVSGLADNAFSGNTNITSIFCGTNITTVGSGAFSNCSVLKAVCFDGDAPAFGSSVFSGTSGVQVYHLSGMSGWSDTLDGVDVKTLSLVADEGLVMGFAFDGTNWLMAVENHQTSPATIQAQFISKDGLKVGEPISTGRSGMTTSLAFDGTNYLMIWEDDGLGTLTNGSCQIYGQLISPAGTKVGSAFAISAQNVWCDGIRVIAYGGGKYLVTYTRLIDPALGEDSTNRYIAGCLVDPSGSVGSEFRISTGYGQEGNIAFDGNNFFVVWCEDSNDEEIRGRFVSPSGTLGKEISVNASPYPSDNPKMVAFDGQNYLVVWNDEVGGSDSGEWDTFGQRVATNGDLIGGVITVTDDPGTQLTTALAFDGAHYLAVWSDMQTDGDWDMYGQYISTSGTLLGTRVPLINFCGNQLGGVGFADGNYLVLADDGVVLDDVGVVSVEDSYAMFVAPPTDIDTNSLPDLWEMTYFDSIGVNPDHVSSNGINTVREAYIAGLNPTDPQAFFGITGSNVNDGSLFWDSTAGRVYSVWWTTNLLSGFQCIQSNILWTAGGFTDTVHRADQEGFYKIDVKLQ